MIHSHTYTRCKCLVVCLFIYFIPARCSDATHGTTPRRNLIPGLRVFIKCCSLYHLSARQNYCRCVHFAGRTDAYVYTFTAGRQFVELNVFYCGSGEKEQAKLFESCTGALDTQRENIMNAICPRSRGGECWGNAETWTHGTAECGEFNYCNFTKIVHRSGFFSQFRFNGMHDFGKLAVFKIR